MLNIFDKDKKIKTIIFVVLILVIFFYHLGNINMSCWKLDLSVVIIGIIGIVFCCVFLFNEI